jgi:hypothetical protein
MRLEDLLNGTKWKLEAADRTETEHLEIVERKLDIQKKRLEIRKEKLLQQGFEPRKIRVEEEKVLISKTEQLRYLLSDVAIDEERTLLGSEPIYKPTISSDENKVVRIKLMELLNRF